MHADRDLAGHGKALRRRAILRSRTCAGSARSPLNTAPWWSGLSLLHRAGGTRQRDVARRLRACPSMRTLACNLISADPATARPGSSIPCQLDGGSIPATTAAHNGGHSQGSIRLDHPHPVAQTASPPGSRTAPPGGSAPQPWGSRARSSPLARWCRTCGGGQGPPRRSRSSNPGCGGPTSWCSCTVLVPSAVQLRQSSPVSGSMTDAAKKYRHRLAPAGSG